MYFELDYTNHRGERATRVVQFIRWWHGANEWHREPQWLMQANDRAKGTRYFAMSGIHNLKPVPAPDE